MFNLEQRIAQWRKEMLHVGVKTPASLEELETHLREEIEAQARPELSEEAAFEAALKEIGRPCDLKSEFAKVRETVYERMKQLCFGLAGIQNYQLVTNMNNSIKNPESRWATYAKSAAIIAPAIFVWASFCVLVLPKLNQVRMASGMVLWQPFATVLSVTEFVRANFIVLSVVVLAVLALLEWRSGWWATYRRLVFGVTAYSVNILVLVLMAMLAVVAVVAGAHLLPGK